MARTDVLYATRRAVPGPSAVDVPDADHSDIPVHSPAGGRIRFARVPPAPAAGAGVILIMLGGLTATTGLGPAGWLAGACFAGGLGATLTLALRRRRSRALGPADHVTLARATLTGCVTALVADTVRAPAPVALLVAVTAVALVLDAVDGHVARRTATESSLGARFDMEVDAFLILVLSVYVAGLLGPWVLAIGAMRYVFAAASRALPWLTAPLPHSMTRKSVAAVQGIVLAVAAADVLPRPAAMAATALALAALAWSFARDVGWLSRHRAAPPRIVAEISLPPRPVSRATTA
ncbi:MAG TPA: CDP-alcohol phosphatidyltransferase family protein [Streptosporangiaceae bacterium]|nr:CDP-alcohol phosphatidyltransferase family protein [Streptosporangiaceae bacterium]